MPSEMHKQKKKNLKHHAIYYSSLWQAKFPFHAQSIIPADPFTKQVLQTEHHLPPSNLFHKNKKIPMSYMTILQTYHIHVYIYPYKAKKKKLAMSKL